MSFNYKVQPGELLPSLLGKPMGLIPQNLLVSKSTHIKILKSSKNGKFGRESRFKGVKGKNLVLFLNNEDSRF